MMYPSLPVAITDFSHSPTYVAFVWKILHLMIISLAFNFVIPVLFLFVCFRSDSEYAGAVQSDGGQGCLSQRDYKSSTKEHKF